jgi:TM2 domain-containing membrane protein YozV
MSFIFLLDSRLCKEMIQGPLYYDSNLTQAFHSRVADENNTLTLRCRVICQEQAASYIPHIRIITTKDGVVHDHRNESVFSTDKSPSDNTCDQANPTRDYEFRITARSDILNESIASCVLFYRSIAESDFHNICYTPSIVRIILPNRPTTTMPPTTTTVPPTTPTETTTQDIISSVEPASTLSIQYYVGKIPDGFSYFLIVGVFLAIVVVLIVAVWFLYKKFGKIRKRKTSVQPTQQQVHGGYYVAEDLESDPVNNTQTGQQVASSVKLRTATQS